MAYAIKVGGFKSRLKCFHLHKLIKICNSPPPPSAGPYAMPQPYAMPPPSAGPYAMPQQYAPAGYGGPQQYAPAGYGGPQQYDGLQQLEYGGQQQYGRQQQYRVQQLYPPQPGILNSNEKFGTNSVLMPILCCGGPMLLASIGLYCTVQGKVKNDIASLFYAGMALLALSLVLFVSPAFGYARIHRVVLRVSLQ